MPDRRPAFAKGWRGLALFWAAVLVAVVAGAGTLAWLGPPRRPTEPVATAPSPLIYHSNNNAWPGPPKPQQRAVAAPDSLLLEPAPDFPGARLPRLGPGGRRASHTYAAIGDPADPAPKIGIVVAGMGLDGGDSLAAVAQLPAAADLAVSPYADDPAHLLAAARAAGHELLLSLPMEPAGYPANDEGAHQLLTSATPAENARNLEWALSRIEGYVGVTGAAGDQAGERYADSPALMATVQQELSHRGLFYLDPRAVPGGAWGRGVDVVIDPALADPAAQLAAVEQSARQHGAAIALMTRPSPVLVAKVAAWALSLPGRGITLSPVSLLMERPAP